LLFPFAYRCVKIRSMELLNEVQVAAMLGISHRTLQGWRTRRVGPKYQKISYRVVRYHKADVVSWVKARPVLGGEYLRKRTA
jgi:predicted DNA-binding transcriptional regulator AlpA